MLQIQPIVHLQTAQCFAWENSRAQCFVLEIPQHVVLRIGDCFLDGDGASTEKQLLDRWEKIESLRDPELRPADIAELEELMMECPIGPMKDLKRGLEQTFGASFKDR